MKYFIFTVVFLLLGLQKSFADVSLIAVLNHEGEITTFTSSSSFKDAVDAAVDGDAITLSSGNFTAVDINKNLTIRGAAMMPGENPTILNGDFIVDIDPLSKGSLTMEGLYIPKKVTLNQANDVILVKCQISEIDVPYEAVSINSIRGIHCFITTEFRALSKNDISESVVKSIEFANSFLREASQEYLTGSTFSNCVMERFFPENLANYINCILIDPSNTNSEGTYNHCVSNKYPFGNQPTSAGNQYLPDITDFFKEDSQIYELKDEYVTALLGSDGSQVGIYGGSLPFSPQTTALKITKFNVASKTTSDGKLPIEITVDAN